MGLYGSNVYTTRRTTTGTVISGRHRLVGVSWLAAAGAGTIEFKDGGSSGTSRLIVDTPAAANVTDSITIPDDGILFETDIHVTLTNVTAMTSYYR